VRGAAAVCGGPAIGRAGMGAFCRWRAPAIELQERLFETGWRGVPAAEPPADEKGLGAPRLEGFCSDPSGIGSAVPAGTARCAPSIPSRPRTEKALDGLYV
jgi:hypothetical protein